MFLLFSSDNYKLFVLATQVLQSSSTVRGHPHRSFALPASTHPTKQERAGETYSLWGKTPPLQSVLAAVSPCFNVVFRPSQRDRKEPGILQACCTCNLWRCSKGKRRNNKWKVFTILHEVSWKVLGPNLTGTVLSAPLLQQRCVIWKALFGIYPQL